MSIKKNVTCPLGFVSLNILRIRKLFRWVSGITLNLGWTLSVHLCRWHTVCTLWNVLVMLIAFVNIYILSTSVLEMIKIVTYLFVLTHSDCILLILDYRKTYIIQINLLIQVNHRFYFYCSYISFECRKIKSIEWAGDLCKINGACTLHWSNMKFTHV